jgi:hypothetical protein
MSWNYKAGSVIQISDTTTQTVPAGAENVRPSGWVWVAAWGSDIHGNGSRELPYASINKALWTHSETMTLIFNGVLRGVFARTTYNNVTFVGDGYAVLDGTTLGRILNGGGSSNTWFVGLEIKGYQGIVPTYRTYFYKCNIHDTTLGNVSNYDTTMNRCLVYRLSGTNWLVTPGGSSFNTFVDSTILIDGAAYARYAVTQNIFYNCSIHFAKVHTIMDYSMFFLCKFQFSTGGYTACNTMQAVLNLDAASPIANPTRFEACDVQDPMFQDKNNADFSLKWTSPAKNFNYSGKHIGALGASKGQTLTDIEYTENIAIANGRATLIDPNAIGVIRFAIHDLGNEYELGVVNVAGIMGDRNGEYIDGACDLGDPVTEGQTMEVGQAYVVQGGTINYNSQMYNLNTRVFCVAGATTFTTTESGFVRKILERPALLSVKMKTHRSIGDVNTFNGLSWHFYEIGKKVTCNRVGDVGTGAILRGNAALDFDRTPAKILPVFARYRQVEIVLQVNNLASV